MATGESKDDAKTSVIAIFEALPKSKQFDFIGEYNEALVYIERSTPGKST